MKSKTLAGLFALVLVIFTSACKKDFQTTDSGLRYKYLVESDTGEVAGVNGFLRMHIQIIAANDSMISNTYENNPYGGGPAQLLVKEPTYEGCIYEGFALLKSGDSVMFKVRADSFFTKTLNSKVPDFVKNEEDVTVIVKVLESRNKESFDRLQKEEQENNAREVQKQMEADTKLLEATAEKMGYKDKLQLSPSGLMYVVLKETNGPTAKQGEQVSIFYKGMFVDGTEFDGNIGKEPFKLMIGNAGVIPGWEEAIEKIKLGEKWLLFIPSNLAYGVQGKGSIPANTPLVFEMELASIKTQEEARKEDEAKAKKMRAEESEKIAKFIKRKNYKNLQKTSEGVYYVIEKPAQGPLIKDGEVAVVKVKGYDFDEKEIPMFTMQEPPLEAPLNPQAFPKAMYDALLKMGKGSVARVITPSQYFHGEGGMQGIAPYTPVMLVIELTDIKPAGSAPAHPGQ